MKEKTIKLTALGLSGPGWIRRLEKKKFFVSDWAKEILENPEYEKHRLKKGEEIEVALVKLTDVGDDPTTKELQDYATARGYGLPVAEIALLLREAVSDDEIEKIGSWYICVLHKPIKESGGSPFVLFAFRDGGGRRLSAYWVRPGDQWGDDGLFAFPVLASKSSALESQPLHSDTLPLELPLGLTINGHLYKRVQNT